MIGSGDAVIASTKMRYMGNEVKICLFIPERVSPFCDQYSCSFYIRGGGIDYSGNSIGFDSMQSLILSLKKVGTFLKTSDEIDIDSIEWDGGPMDFPIFESI